MGTGVKVPRPQEGQAHGQPGAVGIELVVVQKGILGGEGDRSRRVETMAEPVDPDLPGGGHRRGDELLQGEGQDHVELASPGQQCLRPQDVSAAGQ